MHGICASNNPSHTEQLKKVLHAGSRAWPGLAPRCDSRTRRLPRSAKGQKPIPSLRAAHELHSVSADSNSDSNLHLKSQTTNCED